MVRPCAPLAPYGTPVVQSAALEVEQWLDSSNHRAVNWDLYAACLPWPVSSLTLWKQQRVRLLRWSGRMDTRTPEDEGPSDRLPAQVCRGTAHYTQRTPICTWVPGQCFVMMDAGQGL